MSTVTRCTRCGRRLRSGDGWNIVFSQGMITGYVCPTCQTPEEHAEAEINAATLDYTTITVDAFGRARVKPLALVGGDH